MKALANVPILVMFGDCIGDSPAGACAKEMAQIEDAGGDITFIAPPDMQIDGSTHMFIQDKNNLQVADMLIDWIDARVTD
ncbi:hypothetical protein [Loktanella sp. M215]|uniref:hypothetical protein n=1 Tax=Loktanella sp. M215 TaxID=2675431 RepID=UPI001F42A09F|nr:hypothetical protein [Loktanella sp. M215]MCF7701811.1 hypothetical protein [Loktanella sp. M215]